MRAAFLALVLHALAVSVCAQQPSPAPATPDPVCPAACSCADGQQLEYSCALPGGALSATLQLGDFLRVQCEDEHALRPPAALPALARNETLRGGVLFDGCGSTGWAAALAALEAAETEILVLRAPDSADEPFWKAEDFFGLEKVQALTLEGGGAVPVRLLAGLGALRRLTLRHMPLVGELPLPHGAPLRWLELGDTALVALPERVFAAAPGLRGLVVWGARGAGVDVAVAAGALVGLEELRVLEVRDVPLRALPGGWLALPSLQSARLVRCALQALPADLLTGAVALQNLSLADNQLQTLPAGLLAGLGELRRLELQGNRLATLPPTLLRPARRLLYLDLSDNRLELLEQSTFGSQGELETLILSGNNLTFSAAEGAGGGVATAASPVDAVFGSFSPPSPLSRLRALRRLVLARNRVAALPDDWRFLLPQLRTLDLSHNAFQDLTDADVNFVLFGNDTLLLDMRYNNISHVRLSAAVYSAAGGEAGAGSVHVLLAGNPLRCDCELHELLRRAAPAGPFELARVRCAAPREWRGHPLSAVPPAALQCALPTPPCPPTCACALRPGLAGGLLTLACPAPPSAASWPDPVDVGLPTSALRLTAPPTAAFALPPHCHRLSLAGLNLTQVPAELPTSPALSLDLSDNALGEVPARLTAEEGPRLLLAGNPWRCDCAVARGLARLHRAAARVDDWSDLRCADGAPLAGVRVADCPAAAWPALAAGVALAALAAATAAALTLRYARELRGWAAARGLACCWPADPMDAADGEKRFDAFVSYAHGDERWVVSELAPRLERAGLRLCLHFRDWEAGGWIPEQIERSVRQSRRTLLVVSPAYLASEWAQHEWRAALAQARPRLVLLLRGLAGEGGAALPPELRAHMTRHTYVAEGDPWFWSKLRVALPQHPVAPPSPAERRRRDVTRKLSFDDRLEALYADPSPVPPAPPTLHPASPAPAERALMERLEPAALKV